MTTPTGTEAGDLNLDKLEALARAATPGPWESFTEPSFAGWYAIRDPQSESEIGSGDGGLDKPDADFIAAFNPEAALALIALAHRAAPATSPHAAPDSAAQPVLLAGRIDNKEPSLAYPMGEPVLLVLQRANSDYLLRTASPDRSWFATDEQLDAAGMRLTEFVPRVAEPDSAAQLDTTASASEWTEVACEACDGEGSVVTGSYRLPPKECVDCNGTGRAAHPVQAGEAVEVKKLIEAAAEEAAHYACRYADANLNFYVLRDRVRASLKAKFAASLAPVSAQPSLAAILNCYSPDDTVSDYQDKIRALYTAQQSAAPTIDVAYDIKDAAGEATKVVQPKSVMRHPDGSYTAFIDAPVSAQQGAAVQQSASVEQQANVPPPFAAPAGKLCINRLQLSMAVTDEIMVGARARSVDFRDGVTFGVTGLHHKILELAGVKPSIAGAAKGGDTNSNSVEFGGISGSNLAAKAPAAQAVDNASRPCPFCGSQNISDGEISTTDIADETVVQSVCMDCGACGPGAALDAGEIDYGDVKAIAAWNRRAPEAMTSEQQPATQQDEDATRFRQAIALEDNAETLLMAVINNFSDGEAIRAEFDEAMSAHQAKGGQA